MTDRILAVPALGERHHPGGQRHGHGHGHGAEAYAAAAGERERPADPADAASVLGIPEHMLTEEVRAAVVGLMAALDQARAQLDQARHHAALLDAAAHRHHVLPLLDRRGMAREVGRLAAHAAQGGLGGAFVLLHVGGIERLRLTEGLAAADAALLHVAEVLAAGVRQGDSVAAVGGGDFALLLPLAEPAAAAAKAALLGERVNRPPFRWRGGEVVLPVTHGVAPVAADGALPALLAEADALRR